MKRIEDETECERIIKKLESEKYFATKNLEFQIYRYGKGEFLCQPCSSDERLQVVVEGTVNIYHIRDDGSKYFIAMNEGIYLLGDMEFMNPAPCIYFAEAVTPVTAAVLSLKKYRSVLKQDIKFMNLIASALAAKLGIVANGESVSASLEERILNHMKYHCENGILKGLGKTAFRLHCSERQLQRILNHLEDKKIVGKYGKGTYRLL